MISNRRAKTLMMILLVSVGGGVASCSGDGERNPAGSFEVATVDVAALLSARILEIRPGEGEKVSAGDTLVVLDTEHLRLRRVETLSGREGLKAQRRAAAAEKSQATSRAGLLETTLSRIEKLRDEGSVTRQKADEVQTELEIAKDRIEAASARIAAIEADLDRLDAALAVIDDQIEDGVVTAPISGTVLLRVAEPGEVAGPGRPLLRLADLSTLELRVFLEAEDLGRVSPGMRLDVLVDAFPGEKLSGRVTWISDEAEFTPKNAQTSKMRAQLVYAVKLAVDNPEGRLHPGMPAEVVLR